MYQLMCFDDAVKTFEITGDREATNGMTDWLSNRQAVRERAGMEALFAKYDLLSFKPFVEITHCLGLNDCYWVKEENEQLLFDNMNLYENSFDDVISQVAFTGNGKFTPGLSPEFTTHGGLCKRWLRDADGEVYLLKGGDNEPYAEYVASQLCKKLEITNHVPYRLMDYDTNVVSACPLFTSKKIGFRPASQYLNSYNFTQIKDVFGGYKDFWQMMLLDYLILNTDRHLNNFGFMVNNMTEQVVSVAPIFDNGTSLGVTKSAKSDLYEYANTRLPAIGGSFFNNITPDIERLEIAKTFSMPGNEFVKQACEIIRYQAVKALIKLK